MSVICNHNDLREAPNIDDIVDTMNEIAPSTNWVHVMENLDHKGLIIPDESAFDLLMAIYARACKDPFPLHAVLGSLWKNTDGQISFLKHAVLAPADKFTFSHSSNRLAFRGLCSLNPAWHCLDLLKVLCQLAESGDISSVQIILEDPLDRCPELLLVVIGHVNTEHNLLQQQVLSCVFPSVLNDTAKSNVVKYLWDINPSLTLQGFVQAHSDDPRSLLRIVDQCQDVEILSAVLDSSPTPFNIKLAAAASRKYHNHVKKWLSEKPVLFKGRFLEERVHFLEQILSSTAPEQALAEVINLYWGSFPLFVEVCKSQCEELVSTHLLDENSTGPFDTICNNLEEQVREISLKCLLQPSYLNVVEEHIAMLQKDRQSSKDLITEEVSKFSELRHQRWGYRHSYIRPELFKEEYGPVIDTLKTLVKSNDDTLKSLEKGLLKYFIGDALSRQVNDIFERNMKASKRAGAIICEYHDYLCRFNIEISWLKGVGRQIELIHELLSDRVPDLEEGLGGLKSEIRELRRRWRALSKERPQNFYSHCEALDALAQLGVDIGILSNKLISLSEAAEDLCLTSKNQRTLLIEKSKYSTRFFHSKEHVMKESSKVHKELLGLKLEVDQAKLCYDKKMVGFPEVSDKKVKYERIIVDNAMSWRSRLLLGRYILGEMRKQGLDMCAYVSTVVMTESLNKCDNARRRAYAGRRFRPKEFDIKLSEYHLQDTMREYCAENKMKGSKKLQVCLERMIDTGVVSEIGYDKPDPEATELTRYHISAFEKMEASDDDAAFHKLDDAKVLVGTFGITKGYYSLGKDDLYDVDKEDVLETSASGNKLTHAVVIVGYGMSPERKPYYVYQNWYGPGWGKGGFGKVTCRSILQLYSASLYPSSQAVEQGV